ncbi:MAG: amidase family protein, partial [Candidatus Dormibacteraeota bacterium]|nr:amidase family protein [Candidatus Dormibacteraeota bacterium]
MTQAGRAQGAYSNAGRAQGAYSNETLRIRFAAVPSTSKDSLAWTSAVEIAHRVSAGDLDPQAIVRAQLRAIEQLDSRIHAYIFVDSGARASDGPLSGVTMAVKDNIPVAGMPWTDGTPMFRDRVAEQDAVPVAWARSAGAAILGKTNLPE